MKKVSSIITGALASVLFFGAVASATDSGSITNTGPGSTNTITTSDQCSLDVTNTNNVDITNDNSQTAGSGDATNDGNTTGGSAQSGSASNTSTTDVGINITNGSVTDCNNVPQPINPGNGGGGEVNAPTGGGRGAGQVSGAQVQAPVGGVGAGSGGLVTSILGMGIVSAGLGLYRLKKSAFEKA